MNYEISDNQTGVTFSVKIFLGNFKYANENSKARILD